MDKVLLTAFLSALAGFITAALSIVKLVNEKESKTTEYRQAWTESVRSALAELSSKLNALAHAASAVSRTYHQFIKVVESGKSEDEEREAVRQRAINVYEKAWQETRNAHKDLRQEVYHSFAQARLHFKPNDTSFDRIEQKFSDCMSLVEKIQATKKETKRVKMEGEVHSAAKEISNYARDILKQEWETVKLGEPAYKKTKKWSIRVCIGMLFILLTIGIHAGLSIWNAG